MFVVSMKASKKKLIVWGVVIILMVLLCFLLFGRGGDENYAVSALGKYSLSAQDNTARLDFLSQFGWQASGEPVEICEVIIPETFNEVYEKYNDIQKEQGLDLSKYCGERCKRWTYEITNYPGQTEGVRANLLILDGRVIGGDISSTELGGFMHGFHAPEAGGPESTASEGINSSQPDASALPEESAPTASSDAPMGTEPETSSAVSSEDDEPMRSTERETLAPDPEMPEAPTD